MAHLDPMVHLAALAPMRKRANRSNHPQTSARARDRLATADPRDSPDRLVKADPQDPRDQMDSQVLADHLDRLDPTEPTATREPRDHLVIMAVKRQAHLARRDHLDSQDRLVHLDPRDNLVLTVTTATRDHLDRVAIAVETVAQENRANKVHLAALARKVCLDLVRSVRQRVWLQDTKQLFLALPLPELFFFLFFRLSAAFQQEIDIDQQQINNIDRRRSFL